MIYITKDVLLSGVGEPFLEQNIRYHCPIYCVLKFDKPKLKPFSRHIWLFDRGNYESLSQEISNTNWDMLKNNDINIYANNLTEQVIKVVICGKYKNLNKITKN